MPKAECYTHHERTNGPIHRAFGLTYARYYVVPRLVLQGMPLWWQKIFIWLVAMLPDTPEYICQRRNSLGHFIKEDPWGNYRHGRVQDIQRAELDERIKNAAPGAVVPVTEKEWKLLRVEN